MKVYIIAGEPSGDLLASGLMRALVRLVPSVRFRGAGGESMAAAGAEISETEGFKSLFDIAEISVMGVFEVLPRLPLILKRIRQTINDIERFAPDVIVTVDSWGFVSALISRLRKKWRSEGRTLELQPPVIHYVAPQVWAWKKGRAKNVARLLDRLMTLLPDEGKYFEKYGLHCDFVGHPVPERVALAQATLDLDGFRAANGIPADATVVSVLPGSRHSEIKRLIPIMKEAVLRISAKRSDAGAARTIHNGTAGVFVVVPTVGGVEREVRRGFEGFSIPVRVVTGEASRYNAFSISDLALAKSGTVSLELVAMGVPHLIAYTFGRLSDMLVRMLVKVRFANLINILANREIIPEFVLWRCRPELIANCASELLASRGDATGSSAESGMAVRQVSEAQKVLQKLRLPDILPSDRAAQIVAEVAASASSAKCGGNTIK